MQTPERFKYVVRFLFCFLSQTGGVLHLSVGKHLKVACRIDRLAPFLEDVVSPRLKITVQILLSGPSSGSRGLSYQHTRHLWTYASLPVATGQILPSSA